MTSDHTHLDSHIIHIIHIIHITSTTHNHHPILGPSTLASWRAPRAPASFGDGTAWSWPGLCGRAGACRMHAHGAAESGIPRWVLGTQRAHLMAIVASQTEPVDAKSVRKQKRWRRRSADPLAQQLARFTVERIDFPNHQHHDKILVSGEDRGSKQRQRTNRCAT